MYIPTQLNNETGPDSKYTPSPDLDGFNKQRNVRFDGDKPTVLSADDNHRTTTTGVAAENSGTTSGNTDTDGTSYVTTGNNDGTSTRKSSIIKRNNAPLPVSLEFLADARRNAPPSDVFTDKFLCICPKDAITLNVIHGEVDPVDVMALKNEGTKNVVYKIKITSPEKFRVRPRTGIINAGETEFIRIHLQNEYKHTIARERFLIMAVEVQTCDSNTDFATVWKNADSSAKVEHKLKCYLNRSNSNSQSLYQTNISNGHMASSFSEQNGNVSQQLDQISQRQKLLCIGVILLIALQIFSLLYITMTHSYARSLQQRFPATEAPPVNVEPIDDDSDL